MLGHLLIEDVFRTVCAVSAVPRRLGSLTMVPSAIASAKAASRRLATCPGQQHASSAGCAGAGKMAQLPHKPVRNLHPRLLGAYPVYHARPADAV